MMQQRIPKRQRFVWGAAALVLVLVSALAVFAPQAVAQSRDNAAVDSARYLEIFQNTYRFILRNYVDEPDARKLYEGAMKGMLESLGDPYSVFLDEALMSDMTDLTSGDFGGVGVYISKQARDPRKPEDAPRYIEIVSPIEDTPGWKAGLKPGDLITKIDGEPTAPLSSDDAQTRIRGKIGSPVVLTIRRGQMTEFDVSLVRARIEIPTIKKALIPTKTGAVAYMRIIEFSPQTLTRAQEALREFERAGYRGLIIDVRNNPGGLLASVTQVANLFLDSGVIVSTKGRTASENEVFRARPGTLVPKDKPIVLLINRASASASEILAGALKDNKRAALVGENSYGKGSVQTIFPLDSTGFKLTISRYYTPSDENIDKAGIPPDIEVKEPEFTDAQIAAYEKLLSSGKISDFAKANPSPTTAQRNLAATALAKEFGLPEHVLRRLVRDELNKTSITPVYDLEFDTALNAALAALDRPDFADFVAGTKTVKELVEAKKLGKAAEAADKANPGSP